MVVWLVKNFGVQVDSWICGVHCCGCCIPCQCPWCQRLGGMNLTLSSFSSNYLVIRIAALRLWIRTRYGDPVYFKFNGKMLKNDDLFSDERNMLLNCWYWCIVVQAIPNLDTWSTLPSKIQVLLWLTWQSLFVLFVHTLRWHSTCSCLYLDNRHSRLNLCCWYIYTNYTSSHGWSCFHPKGMTRFHDDHFHPSTRASSCVLFHHGKACKKHNANFQPPSHFTRSLECAWSWISWNKRNG